MTLSHFTEEQTKRHFWPHKHTHTLSVILARGTQKPKGKTLVSGHSAPVLSSRMSVLFTPSLNLLASPWLCPSLLSLTIPWDSVHLHHFLVALAEVAG